MGRDTPMSQDATMVVDAIESTVNEIVIRHLPVQEVRDSRQSGEEPAASNPRRNPVPSISHLMLRMQESGDRFNALVGEATRSMIQQIDAVAEPAAPANAVSTTRLKLLAAENEFLARILEASRTIHSERQILADKIQHPDAPNHGSLLLEIIKTEAAIRNEACNIQQMIDDPAADLSFLMRANAALNETKAYLKGLRFQVAEASR
jgi:hypothetical protein